jgi:hypothetical protein
MTPEKIDPISSERSEKKERNAPDSKKFEEMMKVSEVELEKKKDRSWGDAEEEPIEEDKKEEDVQASSKGTSPYETTFYESDNKEKKTPTKSNKSTETNIQMPKGKKTSALPKGAVFWDDVDVDEMIKADKSKKEKSIKGKKAPLSKNDALKLAKGKVPSKDKIVLDEQAKIASKNKEALEKKYLKEKSAKLEKITKNKKPDDETKKDELVQLNQLPTPLFNQVQTALSQITTTLHPDVSQLFEHMIGTIVQIDNKGVNKGISTTEIILNNPAFANSVFAGSSITFTKYSTAPNSYNIRLSGSNKAVSLFNANISQLVAAFKKGGFDFQIGRIYADYEAEEKPLFHRKKKIGEKSSDSGDRPPM